MRHERARIAAELHDIVGHALSVMVIQAAAGQRLAGRGPDAAQASIHAIADSARQGQEDLQRLIGLLGGAHVVDPDLGLIDELVNRAARTGLSITCRFEGDRDGVSARTAQAAIRVVQEALTNALRHAPGSNVRVLVGGEGTRDLLVRVENDNAARPGPNLAGSGSGRGIEGMRERVFAVGGTLTALPTPTGGWTVEARIPQLPTATGTQPRS